MSRESWQKWAEHAQQGMDACGIAPELLMTRALMLGWVPRDRTPLELERSQSKAPFICRQAGPGPVDDTDMGLLGMTLEMLAYRWLEQNYPEVLRGPK